MGSVGDCYDNALCESFFATLECELIDRNNFATLGEARRAVFEFIEGWYNPHRLHSALGYHSPIHFERNNRREKKSQAKNCPRKWGRSRPMPVALHLTAYERRNDVELA